jgi:hypothetical protein
MPFTINCLKTIQYKRSVRYSEHARQIEAPGAASPMANGHSVGAALLKQALFRDQIQSAIKELIRGYEATTGLNVVRVEYQPEGRNVIIDALPARR